MRNFNLITVTLAFSLLSVQATNTKETTTVTIPKNVREKYLNELYFAKVNPTLIDEKVLDFFPQIEAGKQKNIEANKHRKLKIKDITAVKTEILSKKSEFDEFLKTKKTLISTDRDWIENLNFVDLFSVKIHQAKYIKNLAEAVIDDEDIELNAIKENFEMLQALGSNCKDYAESLTNHVQEEFNCYDRCGGISIRTFVAKANYKKLVTAFKTWSLFKLMTEGPKAPKERIQAEFVRPNWKNLIWDISLKSDNVFIKLNLKVATIPESLKFTFLDEVENLEPEYALQTLLTQLDKLIDNFEKDETSHSGEKLLYLNDLRMRQKFIEMIHESGKSLDLKDTDIMDRIRGHVRTIERLAEGIIRAIMVMGIDTEILNIKSIENILKLWLMNEQMFGTNSKYVKELIQIPKDWKLIIEPTAAPFMETDPSASVSANPVTPKTTFPVVIDEKSTAVKDADTRKRSDTAETATSENSDHVPVDKVAVVSKSEPKQKSLFGALGF